MIKVLIVADRAEVRHQLAQLLQGQAGISVQDTVASGTEAIAALQTSVPDVLLVSDLLSGPDSLEITREIMETLPTRVILIGDSRTNDASFTRAATEAGALAVVRRPPAAGQPFHEAAARELLDTIRLMSEIRVVRRWRRRPPDIEVPPRRSQADTTIQVVAIGASSGGPPALNAILSAIRRDFPAPILIVQHISPGFTPGMVEWLAQSSGFPVSLARHGELPLSGHAYVAPDHHHLTVTQDGRIALLGSPPEHGHRPAVAALFRSVASVFGSRGVGVLLTGMGRDGAQELKLLRDAGGITIAQDKESSVVHGMPGQAILLGAAQHVLPPPRIAALLNELAAEPAGSSGAG